MYFPKLAERCFNSGCCCFRYGRCISVLADECTDIAAFASEIAAFSYISGAISANRLLQLPFVREACICPFFKCFPSNT